MIKKIEIYECGDGTRFDDEERAQRYEDTRVELRAVERKYLGPRAEEVKRGKGTQEHPIENVIAYRKEICRIAGEYIPSSKWVFDGCGDGTRHISHANRVVSDCDVKMLDVAFFRLNCINLSSGREYEQPYYALHPEEWEDYYEKYVKPNLNASMA